MRLFGWVETLFQDVRYAVRTSAKNPVFTIAAVLTVGVSIGVNTAIFTLLNLRFQPLPIEHPDTAVRLDPGSDPHLTSFTAYAYLRDHTQVFSGLTASDYQEVVLGASDTSEGAQYVNAKFVSDNFFSELGVSPLIGRTFSHDEAGTPGRGTVAVLSHHFWQRHFGGDPNILGRTLLLNGRSLVIIGVTPREFVGFGLEEGPVPPEVWLPLMMRGALDSQDANRDYFGPESGNWLRLSLCGRLKPGLTREEALAEAELLLSQLGPRNTLSADRDEVRVIPLALTGDAEIAPATWAAIMLVMAATLTVLLVACANIASLLLARAAARKKEIGLRLCLGATPGRLIRQLLTESLLLAGFSGLLGLLLAWWGLKALLGTSLLSSMAGGQDLGLIISYLDPDARVLAYTLLVTLIAGLAFGLVPAWNATRTNLVSALKDQTYSFGHKVGRLRLSNTLVIMQVALCLVLMIAAGLIARGLDRIREENLGFNTKNVLIVDFSLKSRRYDPQREHQLRQELTTRLGGVPGVQSVSQAMRLPVDLMKPTALVLEGAGETPDNQVRHSLLNRVTQDYFNTLGIPITRGRGFMADEIRDGADVVIITESTARNLWQDQEPIGRKFRLEEPGLPVVEVIGVARDTRNIRTGEIDPIFIYAPLASDPHAGTARNAESNAYPLLVQTAGDGKDLKPAVLASTQAFDPTLLLSVRTIPECIAGIDHVSWARPAPVILTGLGLIALLLAAIGIYGVISYSVNQQTHEIGIRMALGATRTDVLRLVIGKGLKLVGIGAAIGIAGGVALSRVLTSLLFGLSPLDPIAYIGVSLFLLTISLIATYLPASRAAKVDPMVALRLE